MRAAYIFDMGPTSWLANSVFKSAPPANESMMNGPRIAITA